MGTVNPDRIGVVTGTETFFCDPLDVKDVYRKYGDPSQIDYGRWIEAAMREIEPLWMLKYLPNMVSCQISIAIDARGPSNSIVQGDASSLLAVIEAANLIRRGTADVMIVGGSGSKTNLVGMVFHGVDNLCRNVEDPTAACRPFDLQRSGRILGEGAGMLVLESAAHAAQRGATPLGRITGMASSCCTLQQNKQATIARVLGQAAEAIGRELIDHVAAFGESDREADVIEAQAIANVLPDVDVLALKSYYGSTGAGGGAMDLVASLTAMEHDCLPATLNYQTPDPACPLRLSNDHLQKSQSHAIVLAHSYTGQSAAIAVSSMR
jgi:3-oxoacyl-[acyl-carrier-protein] synthase II